MRNTRKMKAADFYFFKMPKMLPRIRSFLDKKLPQRAEETMSFGKNFHFFGFAEVTCTCKRKEKQAFLLHFSCFFRNFAD